MKTAYHVLATLVALLFLFSAAAYFFNLVEMPTLSWDLATFNQLMMKSGYMAHVKLLEALGGLLLLIPSKRALASLILAPITLNIVFVELMLAHQPGIGFVLLAFFCFLAVMEKDKFKPFFR